LHRPVRQVACSAKGEEKGQGAFAACYNQYKLTPEEEKAAKLGILPVCELKGNGPRCNGHVGSFSSRERIRCGGPWWETGGLAFFKASFGQLPPGSPGVP
jgi:hypothetical protein